MECDSGPQGMLLSPDPEASCSARVVLCWHRACAQGHGLVWERCPPRPSCRGAGLCAPTVGCLRRCWLVLPCFLRKSTRHWAAGDNSTRISPYPQPRKAQCCTCGAAFQKAVTRLCSGRWQPLGSDFSLSACASSGLWQSRALWGFKCFLF